MTAVILAAGRSSRMGRSKARLSYRGLTLLEHALRAAAAYERILVAPPDLVHELDLHAGADESPVTLLANGRPELGMTHSLQIAIAALDARARLDGIVVLLVDTPLVDAALVAQVVLARGSADVAFPVREAPGHPVAFGPRAIDAIAKLPAGDTLRTVRDDPALTRVRVAVTDDRPFIDVDTPAAFERFLAGDDGSGENAVPPSGWR